MNTSLVLTKEQRKNIIIGGLTVALILSSGIAAVSAAGDNKDGPRFQKDPEVQQIIEEKDFAAWQALDEEKIPGHLQNFNESQFNDFTEMIAAFKAGDIDAAKEIRASLDLPERPEKGHKKHHGKIKELVEGGDYTAWAEALAKRGVDEAVLTPTNFERLQAAFEVEDRETVRALHEELGLEGPHHHKNKGKHLGEILNADYETWVEKAAQHGIETKDITPENFVQLQKAAELFKSGDKDAAKLIMQELDIHPERPDRDDREDDQRPERRNRGFHGQPQQS